jgi:hypothetical protein
VVDPPNGLIPGNDLYQQQIARGLAGMLSAMDGPEQRPAAERCLGSATAQPPILGIRNGVITERFARVAEDRIDYSFTVEDPTYYTQPWQGESHFLRRDERMLEYACHEANYSMVHILEGARERDRQEVR